MITRTELHLALQRLDIPMANNKGQLQSLLQTIDTNHDGGITFDEFERWMLRGKPAGAIEVGFRQRQSKPHSSSKTKSSRIGTATSTGGARNQRRTAQGADVAALRLSSLRSSAVRRVAVSQASCPRGSSNHDSENLGNALPLRQIQGSLQALERSVAAVAADQQGACWVADQRLKLNAHS